MKLPRTLGIWPSTPFPAAHDVYLELGLMRRDQDLDRQVSGSGTRSRGHSRLSPRSSLARGTSSVGVVDSYSF